MKSDSHLNKFFITQMIILNIVITVLIVRELVNFNNFNNIKNTIGKNEFLTRNKIDKTELEFYETKYQQFLTQNSNQNTLGELITFIENKTEENNLRIVESKVIYATNEEINYEIGVTGTMSSIYSFILAIEEDLSLKEITNTRISFNNNNPTVRMSIIAKKL